MNCADLEANLTDFLDGILDDTNEDAALEHVATCERCEAVLTGTRSVITLASRHGRIELGPDERRLLLDRILASGTTDEGADRSEP